MLIWLGMFVFKCLQSQLLFKWIRTFVISRELLYFNLKNAFVKYLYYNCTNILKRYVYWERKVNTYILIKS